MPTVIVLQDIFGKAPFETLYFLLKEDLFPVDGLKLIQQKVREEVACGQIVQENIINIVEDTIGELGYTILPYSLYVIKY